MVPSTRRTCSAAGPRSATPGTWGRRRLLTVQLAADEVPVEAPSKCILAAAAVLPQLHLLAVQGGGGDYLQYLHGFGYLQRIVRLCDGIAASANNSEDARGRWLFSDMGKSFSAARVVELARQCPGTEGRTAAHWEASRASCAPG